MFAACSNGNRFSSPDYKKLDRRARSAQRKLSRREKGSKRRERVRLRAAKLKARIRDIRKDFLHKLSTKVVNEASKNIEKVGAGHTHDSKWAGRERNTSIEAAPAELSTRLEYEQLRLFNC